MSTDSFLARSLRWSVHTDATFMLMAHDICTRVSRAPREGCVFACVCVEILNEISEGCVQMWDISLTCGAFLLDSGFGLLEGCSSKLDFVGPIITFPCFHFFSFFLTCFTLTATCLVCNKYTQEGGAVFEQESKQFSTTVKMCLNTNKYGINYYVYGQEYVKKISEIITFVFSFN